MPRTTSLPNTGIYRSIKHATTSPSTQLKHCHAPRNEKPAASLPISINSDHPAYRRLQIFYPYYSVCINFVVLLRVSVHYTCAMSCASAEPSSSTMISGRSPWNHPNLLNGINFRDPVASRRPYLDSKVPAETESPLYARTHAPVEEMVGEVV